MVNKVPLVTFIACTANSSFITFLIAFIFNGNIHTAILIGVLGTIFNLCFYYFFEKITAVKIKPAVIWLTGLSGSGKTTVANNLKKKLKEKSIGAIILDGDDIRHVIGQLGFDED